MNILMNIKIKRRILNEMVVGSFPTRFGKTRQNEALGSFIQHATYRLQVESGERNVLTKGALYLPLLYYKKQKYKLNKFMTVSYLYVVLPPLSHVR